MISFARNLFLNMKLRNKLALIYSVIIIIPIIVVGLTSYAISEKALINEVTKLLESDVDKSSDGINAMLKSWLDRCKIIAASDLIMNKMPTDYHNDYPRVFAFYNELNTMMSSILAADELEKNTSLSNVELYCFNPTLLKDEYYVKNPAEFVGTPAINGGLTRESLEGFPNIFWLPAAQRSDQTGAIRLCSKLFTTSYQYTTGMICIYIPVASLKEELSRANLPPGGWVLYLDADNNEIFRINQPDSEYLSFWDPTSTAPGYHDTAKSIYFMRSTPANGGRLILSYPKSHLRSKVSNIYQLTQAIVFISIIGAIVVSYLVAGLITKRLTMFVTKVSQMVENEATQTLPSVGNDEIGLLSIKFNAMVDRVNLLLQEKYQSSINRRILELELLESQVNPHFLYNMLSTIKWIGNGVIGEIVDSIVKYFRVSLNRGSEAISVADEIDMTMEYVKIQQFIFDERFKFDCYVDPTLEGCYIIKLVLQPFVENAILHGINAMKDFTGRVSISATREEGFVLLSVEDNGSGMDESTLTNLSDSSERRKINKGYGIRNVRERLKLFYEDKFDLSIESEPNVGTKVAIRLPCYTEEELQNRLRRFV